jgi:hypothetical protein
MVLPLKRNRENLRHKTKRGGCALQEAEGKNKKVFERKLSVMTKKSFYDGISADSLFDLMEETSRYINDIQHRKKQRLIPKLFAGAAAIFLLFCVFNITGVVAFFKNLLLFIPGFGITENDVAAFMLWEPVEMDCEFGNFKIEFGTKVAGDDGKCDIMLFLTTSDNIYSSGVYIEDLNARAMIDKNEYILESIGHNQNFGSHKLALCLKNDDFPDINEFYITFGGQEAHIVLTPMSEDEKIPYLSGEYGGITLAFYKYRNNNRFLGFDVINNNDSGDFKYAYTSILARLYDEKGNEIKLAGGTINKENNVFESNLTNGLLFLDNENDTEVKKIEADCVIVNYQSDLIKTADGLYTWDDKQVAYYGDFTINFE